MASARAALAVTVVFAGAGVALPAAGAASPQAHSPGALFAASCKNQSRQRVPGVRSTSYGRCFTAMLRLAQAKSRSPLIACATLSRKRVAGTTSSPFSRCVAAGRTLTRRGNGIDLSYVEEMIPHHVAAVQMAQYALEQGESEYVRTLAANIIRSQTAEIATMRQIAAQLRAAGIRPVPMGLTMEQMGMNHDTSHIVGAHPFDVVFVDMMIPHHEGAIRMSEVLFARGTGRRTEALAEQIVASQSREIHEMQEFRLQTTGASAPPLGENGPHPH
jgi:uncharacterized protein (DUF305 family)